MKHEKRVINWINCPSTKKALYKQENLNKEVSSTSLHCIKSCSTEKLSDWGQKSIRFWKERSSLSEKKTAKHQRKTHESSNWSNTYGFLAYSLALFHWMIL